MYNQLKTKWLAGALGLAAGLAALAAHAGSPTLRVVPGEPVSVNLTELLGLDPVVVMQTTAGDIPIKLTPQTAPQTVDNFLFYVNSGRYTDSFIHRSAMLQDGQPFVIQGGGFFFDFTDDGIFVEPVPTQAPVINEPNITNRRGTVAMAKLGGDPNSATSQWFINLSDNGPILDNQNGGFTVFGTVIGEGMPLADAIAALPVYDLTEFFGIGALGEVPLADVDEEQGLMLDNFITVLAAVVQEAGFSVAIPSGQPDDLQMTLEGDLLLIQPPADASGSRVIEVSGGVPQDEAATGILTIVFGLDETAFRERYFAVDRTLRQGWRTSNVFGDYYAAEFPWLWHPAWGWVYVLEDSEDAFWMWDALSQGWFWVPAATFPTAYSFAYAAWSYLDPGSIPAGGERWIFIHGAGWEQF